MSRRRGLPLVGRIQLVDAAPEDFEFLFGVLRASMKTYVIQTWGAWDEDWQRERFAESFRAATYQVIHLGGEPVGLWSVRREEDGYHLDRVFLLPEAQNRGLGTRLLRGLQEEAARRGVPIRLRVLKVNPARRLYERHGFRTTGIDENHWLMEWEPT